ncbi:ATP-dependent DNA ligase [Streptomyces marincola]|uniref:ATP-dependent DNA ligase n=1 Tax=Streptomyces marincola TaxID=2878388 RepID=UPI001CF0E1D2|nr:ATP-dependent DNA ligase [Streptomyces marincola]UCM88968.1 ATP-dependent DNA ligase [Streptomyces marincola]
MLLSEPARVWREVAADTARTTKIAALARLLRATEPADAPVVITYLAGRLPQRRLGVGPRALARRPAPAARARLTVRETDAAFTRIAAVSGPGATAERGRLLGELLAAATAPEQDFLIRLVSGELRQGALDAVAAEALAEAAGAAPDEVRRAVMLGGSLGAVAGAVLAGGPAALAEFRLRVGRPVQPMLAGSAPDVDAALDRLGPCAVEEKLDGVRVQVHREGAEVRIWTRTLDEITERLPEVRAAALELAAERAVLDGEVIALDETGRPRPFQELAGRVGALRGTLPVSPVFFDLLALDGRDLLDLPTEERHAELARLAPEPRRVRRLVAEDPDRPEVRAAVREFAGAVLARGHEGVLLKALGAPYAAGRRGGSWLKVKPVHTLDLVVIGAEWGHGRRTGLLSNLHLGARGDDGSFVMLGKTFKGLTDALLAWQTERLGALAVERAAWGVRVRPELVVEVAFDGVQRSTRYPAGVTLRFARVLRYRTDKAPADADRVAAVRALLR